MNKKTKILLKLTSLILFTFLSLFLVFRKDYKDVLAILKTASFPFILIAIGCMLLVFFIDGCILTILVNLFQKGYKLHQGILNQQYNVFFNGITPLATGGQPFQVYLFKKQGVNIANGIAVVFIYFVLYKATLLSLSLFAFIYNYPRLNALIDQAEYNLLFLLIISFCLIALLSIFIILVAYLPLFKKLFHKIIVFLGKIKIIKKVEVAQQNLNDKIILIRHNASHIFSNWKTMVLLLGLMFLRFIILYSIPFISFYAVHCPLDGKYFLDTISLSSYTSLISGVFPSPGGSVGVEFAYTYLFKSFFSNKINVADVNATIKGSMLIWRTITFYFGMILGAFVLLIYKPRKKKENS